MSKILDFIVRCNNASSEDITDDIMRMADPDTFDSRDEMESHFESCLGYNPMRYFDEKYLKDEYMEITNSAPYSVQEQLHSKRDDIIDRTLEVAYNVNEAYLDSVLLNVIESSVGWKPNNDEYVSLDECIRMEIFSDDELDDYTEYEEEDEEDEMDDIFEDSSDEDDYR